MVSEPAGLSEWIAQRVRVLVNFVDPGSIPSGSHFATTHTLATERVAYPRLFPTQGGFRIRDLPVLSVRPGLRELVPKTVLARNPVSGSLPAPTLAGRDFTPCRVWGS